MIYRVTKYGDTQFSLLYDDKELMDIIVKYIQKKKESNEDYFTYFVLCKNIINLADNANKLNGKDTNTYYTSVVLSQKEYTRVSRLLWDLILDRKIFVDFSNNSYTTHYENDTIFGIL